jgi:3' terminal RNA ribose 2'-O-methyltransferase Hen1
MLLTITSTAPNATDLGYLLHKNPGRLNTFDLSFGKAHVFYPEARADRCTVALLIEVDAISLVRGHGTLDQYVNDRPYVASSFLSVAIARVLRTAMSATVELPLEARLAVVPCRGGEGFLRRLFEPLGYEVDARQLDGKYFSVGLKATKPLGDLLSHLYVLVPVLDDDKHYWIGDDEVDKLLRHGEGWLHTHPERDAIAFRYLKHQRSLVRRALGPEEADSDSEEEERLEDRISLQQQRIGTVLSALKTAGAKRVLDLGCGEGQLVRALLKDPFFDEIVGVDVSHRALEIAADRLKIDRLPEKQRQRIKLLHGALTYRDQRLAGYDAAAVVEVIEHLDLPRLRAFERALFEAAKPRTVVVTTPNVEYNVKFDNLPAGKLRHRDHRFEWTRAEFETWARGIAQRFGYAVRFLGVGSEDAIVGAPTQMAVFGT